MPYCAHCKCLPTLLYSSGVQGFSWDRSCQDSGLDSKRNFMQGVCACKCVCPHAWCSSACSFYFQWPIWELKSRKHFFLSTHIENNSRYSFSLTLFNTSSHPPCLQTPSIWKLTWCYFAAPCCIQVGGRDKDAAQLPRTSHPGNKQLLFLHANSLASDILVTSSDKIHRASKHVPGPGKSDVSDRQALCFRQNFNSNEKHTLRAFVWKCRIMFFHALFLDEFNLIWCN